MASAGEQVSVTPRGEENKKIQIFNIQIEDQTLINVIKEYIDNGKVNIDNKNVSQGAFAV